MKLSVMDTVRSIRAVGLDDADRSRFRRAGDMLFSRPRRDREGSRGPWSLGVVSDAMVRSITVASKITDMEVFIPDHR